MILGNFTAEAEIMRELYLKRATEKLEAARSVMADADRSKYKCDPRKWVEGENYVRLTKLLQGYIENEVRAKTIYVRLGKNHLGT